MTTATEEGSGALAASSERGFWGIFAFAWIAYFGLFVTVDAAQAGRDLGWMLRMGVVNAGPPAALGWLVAWRRRELLRPEWTLGRLILLHVAVGLLYSVGTALVATALVSLLGYGGEAVHPSAVALRSLNGAFLYVVLAGFLMWTEALRRTHESRSLAAREAALRARAEAKAVRAQFNPHFVFNTLHSLMLLIRADPPAAERAIEDVATLIRYASILQRRDVDTVPLVKELEVARRYAELEKLRLEERLRVAFAVDVDPAEVEVPAFALQTLLENAVKHGIEPRDEGGTVRIAVARDGERLRVAVSDDGAGAPSDLQPAEGHGLDLLARRLRGLYGGDGALTWTTAPGEGFSVTLALPARAPGPMGPLEFITPRVPA